MKRVQLFEFEDFNWFPSWLRSSMTNLIVVFQKLMGVDEVLASHISKVLKDHDLTDIVDLGSGSGGVMPTVLQEINKEEGGSYRLTLTDLYPNGTVAERFNSSIEKNVQYLTKSVTATEFENIPNGLKTMINCFHHMRPKQARQIVESAYANDQPIFIYELTENKIPLLVWWLLLPLSLVIVFVMALFLTPFVKPMTWQQIVFTYLIPIIPLFYAWDGQASLPRMYSFKDIDELVKGLSSDAYKWEKGYVYNGKGKKNGTYVLGTPIQ